VAVENSIIIVMAVLSFSFISCFSNGVVKELCISAGLNSKESLECQKILRQLTELFAVSIVR
jgi:hypothetical protein